MEAALDKKTPDEIDEMCSALSSIAIEIQRYSGDTVSLMSAKNVDENKINFKYYYKYKLKNKRNHIATLRKNLKSACWVAKTLETAKKREVTTLARQLEYARGECVDLLERYNNNINTIGSLHKQNLSLHERLENLANFISLGFEELKKIKREDFDEVTTLAQLKKIIESCGQFYADYCNEFEMNSQIKQRNRFLKNKIVILENNLEAMKEQLKSVEYRCLRLKTGNVLMRSKSLGAKCLNFSCTEVKKVKEDCENSSDEKRYQDSGDSVHDHKGFDLSTHLEIVRRLLIDQDTLLKDLNTITKNMSVI